MTSIYDLMANLGKEVEKREYAESLFSRVPERVRPLVSEIFVLMRHLEEIDQYMLDEIGQGGSPEYEMAAAEHEVWHAKLKAKVNELGKGLGMDPPA